MAYSLVKNPKFLLDTYKQKVDTNCIHEFMDNKINFEKKVDICYKFHIIKYRTTCTYCNLSQW